MKTKTLELVPEDGIYIFAENKGCKLNRYTGVIDWEDEEGEEIDVDARTKEEAKEIIIAALKQDYMPGWSKLRVIGPRIGLYI